MARQKIKMRPYIPKVSKYYTGPDELHGFKISDRVSHESMDRWLKNIYPKRLRELENKVQFIIHNRCCVKYDPRRLATEDLGIMTNADYDLDKLFKLIDDLEKRREQMIDSLHWHEIWKSFNKKNDDQDPPAGGDAGGLMGLTA